MPRVLRSSSLRLALLYMSLFGASVLILLGFLYWATAGYMTGQAETTLETEIRGLSEQYSTRGLAGLTRAISHRSKDPSTSPEVYLLTDSRFIPLVGNLNQWPTSASDRSPWLRFKLPDKDAHPILARQFELRGGFHLLVGRDLHELGQIQGLILKALGSGLAVTILLAIAGAVIMSRGVLRRIEIINQASHAMVNGDLSRRIPTQGTGDDFDQLAENLNDMLTQIQLLMDDVRRVSDNIAHDLRTPLTRLLGRLDQLQTSELEAVDMRHETSLAMMEAQQLLETFNALLRIARIESHTIRETSPQCNLSDIARDALELYEPLSEERAQCMTWTLPPECELKGDRHLLFQCIANVLDNAVKYTPRGGVIDLTVTSEGTDLVITIADNGPGVPEAHRDAVLRRFFRLESSRTTPGDGLGLALVNAVVRRHGGKLLLQSNCPGLKCRMTFPGPREQQAHRTIQTQTSHPPPFAQLGIESR